MSPADGSPRVRGVLVLMAKEPVPGSVKTRLAPALGETVAAELYAAFLGDLTERLAAFPDVDRVLAVFPAALDAPWLDPHRAGWRLVAQRGANLGERMDGVIRELLALERGPVVMIGSDVPTLPAEHVDEALRRLAAGADVVFGPDPDGGYHLVAVARAVSGLFDVEMSTTSVLAASLERVTSRGLGAELVPAWADVDTPADLARLHLELGDPALAARAPRTAALLARLGGPNAS